MNLISRARCSMQNGATTREDVTMSEAEARLLKKMQAAQDKLNTAQARFDAACANLVAVRCAEMEEKLAKQGLVRGKLITDGARLWGYGGVEHDRISRDPAAVRIRLILVRKNGEIGKPSVPVPANLIVEELRPVRDDEEVRNILSKGELLGGFWTDYPIEELGDVPHQIAPIRRCEPLHYDGDKYVWVRVEGIEGHIKAGYVYTLPGRCGAAPAVDRSKLPRKAAA